mmetsp:Transcript_11971/g.54119  ORF Transcript_11971/g.54119 Transcript_11971/m.54119 type:complete len:242 (+) Transcript_11971:505-1230(+)
MSCDTPSTPSWGGARSARSGGPTPRPSESSARRWSTASTRRRRRRRFTRQSLLVRLDRSDATTRRVGTHVPGRHPLGTHAMGTRPVTTRPVTTRAPRPRRSSPCAARRSRCRRWRTTTRGSTGADPRGTGDSNLGPRKGSPTRIITTRTTRTMTRTRTDCSTRRRRLIRIISEVPARRPQTCLECPLRMSTRRARFSRGEETTAFPRSTTPRVRSSRCSGASTSETRSRRCARWRSNGGCS